MLHCVEGCLMEDNVPSCSPALQFPPCHADPTGTHAGVTSRTEILVPSLVPGRWIIVGRQQEHTFWGLQLVCSSWHAVAS